LLRISESEPIYLLDSCGVGHLGSHLLLAGVRPVEALEVTNDNPDTTLELLQKKITGGLPAIFSLSYDLGKRLQPGSSMRTTNEEDEPDLFVALFDVLIVHDYDTARTFITGDDAGCATIAQLLQTQPRPKDLWSIRHVHPKTSSVVSNFTRGEYVQAVERIQEHIRRGDTYQTNLTQQLRCKLDAAVTPESIYWRLRRDHPAPFGAFLRRPRSTVVSASPERFFRTGRSRDIESSPIKGTRPRGKDPDEDLRLRAELLSSAKDRAENTMIVDLVRNDLGRVCEYGSVVVEKLCDMEEHPTLFHLVSTVRGRLRHDTTFSEILRAVFPCGSITGAPKIRTMQIIGEIENPSRGLSMGAIGMYLPEAWDFGEIVIDTVFDLSVAIRTMVIRNNEAVFNVGGGVVIDSDPKKEYEESLLKAQSLLSAIGTRDFTPTT
jgi:para-aminobenzoate synthetase component I